MAKATVYAFVGNNRGVATDLQGDRKRNEWRKLNLELEQDECIEKLSWRSEDKQDAWGSNNIVVRRDDLNKLTGTLLTLCDAMFTEKEQKDAWKGLIRSTIYEWHDTKAHRYNLELDK